MCFGYDCAFSDWLELIGEVISKAAWKKGQGDVALYPSIMPATIGGMKGFILENEKIRVVVTPGFGARILSLIY